MTRYLVIVRVAEPARKHGISDEDMLHAVRNSIGEWPLDDGFIMCVGPAYNGELVEVGLLGLDSEDPVIVHAMPCRTQYLPHRPPRLRP